MCEPCGRPKPRMTIEHINSSAKLYWWLEKFVGAGDGNRTHVWSLGSSSSTIELHPHKLVLTAIPIMWWEDSVHPCTPPFGPSSHIQMCSDVQNCSRQFCQTTFEAWEAPVLPLNYTRINLYPLRFPSWWWEDSVHPCTPPSGPSSHIVMCSDVQNCYRQFCQTHVWSLGSSSSTIELHPL